MKITEKEKIKMVPLLDRSNEYDTLSFDNDTLFVKTNTENQNNEDNSEND